ncbi:MAG: cytochrome P450 [Alphaproteobacteria bacterium]
MQEAQKTDYKVVELKGLPFIGLAIPIIRDSIGAVMEHSRQDGDIIAVKIMGQRTLLLNHPDLVRHVLVDNHKNYRKSDAYIRFESAIGQGILVSNGEKWRRDRPKVQPMFSRERISHDYFDIVNEVSEKYKNKWLKLTEHGSIDINITEEMAKITTEVILKTIFGKDIDDKTVQDLHSAYSVLIEYLRNLRIFPKIDMRKYMCAPSYFRFRRALSYIDAQLLQLTEKYKKQGLHDPKNFLALLMKAQQENPEYFADKDIRDHAVTMVFAGFESTSIMMQWIWYALDDHAAIKQKLREDIISCAPCLAMPDSAALTYDMLQEMNYLSVVLKETMRLYPPFWLAGRQAIEDDQFGDLKVPRGTVIAVPHITMHRNPKWWSEPNSFIPERFLGDAEKSIDPGIYFPFSLGPRKCSGHSFVDMEARTVVAKLLPWFDVVALNKVGNCMKPGISLKLRHPLIVRISRARN